REGVGGVRAAREPLPAGTVYRRGTPDARPPPLDRNTLVPYTFLLKEMMGRRASCAVLLSLAVAAAVAGCSGPGARAEAPRQAGEELTVHRGPFRQRVLLTGELAAARGAGVRRAAPH